MQRPCGIGDRPTVADVRAAAGLILLGIVVLAACGGSDGGDEQPVATTVPAQDVLVDGLPSDVYDCVMGKWNAVVDEWNTLTEQRDAAGDANVTVDGVEYATFEEWATATGNPLTYDEVRDDPAVVTDCGG